MPSTSFLFLFPPHAVPNFYLQFVRDFHRKLQQVGRRFRRRYPVHPRRYLSEHFHHFSLLRNINGIEFPGAEVRVYRENARRTEDEQDWHHGRAEHQPAHAQKVIVSYFNLESEGLFLCGIGKLHGFTFLNSLIFRIFFFSLRNPQERGGSRTRGNRARASLRNGIPSTRTAMEGSRLSVFRPKCG